MVNFKWTKTLKLLSIIVLVCFVPSEMCFGSISTLAVRAAGDRYRSGIARRKELFEFTKGTGWDWKQGDGLCLVVGLPFAGDINQNVAEIKEALRKIESGSRHLYLHETKNLHLTVAELVENTAQVNSSPELDAERAEKLSQAVEISSGAGEIRIKFYYRDITLNETGDIIALGYVENPNLFALRDKLRDEGVSSKYKNIVHITIGRIFDEDIKPETLEQYKALIRGFKEKKDESGKDALLAEVNVEDVKIWDQRGQTSELRYGRSHPTIQLLPDDVGLGLFQEENLAEHWNKIEELFRKAASLLTDSYPENGAQREGQLITVDNPPRVIVIGDLHTDLASLEMILAPAGEIMDLLKKGEVEVFFTGDFISPLNNRDYQAVYGRKPDREYKEEAGERAIRILILLAELKRAYPANVHILAGNAEFTYKRESKTATQPFRDFIAGICPGKEIPGEIRDFIENMAVFGMVEIGEKKYLLSHAANCRKAEAEEIISLREELIDFPWGEDAYGPTAYSAVKDKGFIDRMCEALGVDCLISGHIHIFGAAAKAGELEELELREVVSDVALARSGKNLIVINSFADKPAILEMSPDSIEIRNIASDNSMGNQVSRRKFLETLGGAVGIPYLLGQSRSSAAENEIKLTLEKRGIREGFEGGWQAEGNSDDTQAITPGGLQTKTDPERLVVRCDLKGFNHPTNSKGAVFVDLKKNSVFDIMRNNLAAADLSNGSFSIRYRIASIKGEDNLRLAGSRHRPNGIQLFLKSVRRNEDGAEEWFSAYYWTNMTADYESHTVTIDFRKYKEVDPFWHVEEGFDINNVVLVGVQAAANWENHDSYPGTFVIEEAKLIGADPALILEEPEKPPVDTAP